MSVTIQDIADELELSVATVSRALQQDRPINPETRARVNEAARRLGYQARVRRPRGPVERKEKTHVLGLLLRSDSVEAAKRDTNLVQMMAGIMAVTDAHRVLLQIHTLHLGKKPHMAEDPEMVPPMVQKGVCQAIIAHGNQDERDLAFLAKRVPVVSMGRFYRSLPIDAAVGDNVEGVSDLVEHLVELGHRRLAWVSGAYKTSFLDARQAGFLQGCLSHGLKLEEQRCFGPEIDKPKDFNIQDKQAVLSAVATGTTAFVCGNDGIAFKVIEVLEAGGYRVPADVSVTGFDAWEPPARGRRLTSVDPRFFEIGKAAARLALQRITEPAGDPLIVSVRSKIVLGETTAPPPSNVGAVTPQRVSK